MLIAAVADLHGFLPNTPECDVLVIAGDICPISGGHGTMRQRTWLLDSFRPWLEEQPAKEKIGVAGNHDFVFAKDHEIGHSLPWTYLENEGAYAPGLTGGKLFWGSPLSGWIGNWAFMKHEPELQEAWEAIPDGVSVLITHGPAYGACDLAQGVNLAGSPSLREAIVRHRPSLHITGHIHEAYGVTAVGRTVVGNASIMNERYEHVNEPLLFRLTEETGFVQQIV